ncbi:uncharacterized protein LOC119432873 isoform X2 [Dermacentor silvarum]|uniref:uncharacterized protein LOC119432873 isoform X2 n=1 Tax=Dermacentor silvarum TaxID=543639 RepID=UPI002101CF55|nr:uncharacterized protein LOC119432873 isoform X2 [Dermacentor silvarum]
MDEDFSLDEFEQQQLERERRRIILDQAVRRKTIDSWVSSRLSVFARPLDEDVAYDDTEVPAPAPPLPPRNPGSQRISWPLGRHSSYDSPPSSPAPPLPTSAVSSDSGPSAARLDLRQKRGANMADQDDQQLIGFDDSPVVLPTEPKKGAAPSEAERILNSLNAEKSQLAAATNGHNGTDETATTNGHHHDEPEKAVNGHVAKTEHNEAGEPVYTEVPEDNIYEEVIPVQENKPEVVLSPTVQTTTTENGVTGVLYDDSSLSSEVSAELSPPPSNVGDCGSNGTTLSDPECDAAMAEASAPESHADIPFVVVQESTPVDSEQSNDEQAEDSASEHAAEEGCKADTTAMVEAASAEAVAVVEPLVKPVVLPVEKTTAPTSDEQSSDEHRCSAQPAVLAASVGPCALLDHIESEFTRVDNVQFVEPEDAARCSVVSVTEMAPEQETAVEECRGNTEAVHTEDIVSGIEERTLSTQEQAFPVEHGLQHEAEELQCQNLAHEVVLAGCEAAQSGERPAVRHESRHLKPSAADSIVAREIRAQKEREEMIARERKLAQEAAKLSSTPLEKPPCDRTPTPETPKPARLTAPQLSTASATSPPSVVSSPAPFPAPIEKRFTCPSDSKIADEIRELQEREEELRELRERLHIQSNDHRCSAGLPISNDDGVAANGVASPIASLTSSSGLSRTVSVESLPPNGSVHTPFGPRRKDKITVRPLSDGTEDSVPSPTFVSHGGESPIEREIRLARDREEALRKEKGLLGQLQAEGFVKKGEVASSASAKCAKVPATVVLRGSTQKILATSRIQQEIEEQTQREMALRESGHIQTISQERTDSKVTRIGNEAGTVASPSPPLASTTRRVPPFESSLPNVEIFEKTPAIVTPARICSPTAAPCGVASAVAKATNGHVHANGHATGAKVSPVANVRGVSMQKFLASRGKELAFTSPPPPQNGDKLEYRELKPPQLQKGAADAVRKGLVTAETKIQEEMRAMKEREEELRRQRLRLLGQSQPNLSLFEGSTVGDADHATDATDGPTLQRVGSDASLQEQTTVNGSSEAANTCNTSSVPRRRSALIAQWEQRIQSTDVAKS